MARQPATETGAWPSLSLATRLARIRADGAPGLADFRPALRGVPPGLPLGFLDGQIRGALLVHQNLKTSG